jgi:hypothetical protein
MEIDVLREYGNKDCLAMADEELERRMQRILADSVLHGRQVR